MVSAFSSQVRTLLYPWRLIIRNASNFPSGPVPIGILSMAMKFAGRDPSVVLVRGFGQMEMHGHEAED
jgi:hypothetical protein